MNILTTLTSFLKRVRAGAHQDPVRDWLAIVFLSIIALAGIIVWNAWVFDTVAGGKSLGSTTATSTLSFDSSSIGIIRDVFANRAAEENKYVTGVYRYADPSQ